MTLYQVNNRDVFEYRTISSRNHEQISFSLSLDFINSKIRISIPDIKGCLND